MNKGLKKLWVNGSIMRISIGTETQLPTLLDLKSKDYKLSTTYTFIHTTNPKPIVDYFPKKTVQNTTYF